jgi:hypothetical protein
MLCLAMTLEADRQPRMLEAIVADLETESEHVAPESLAADAVGDVLDLRHRSEAHQAMQVRLSEANAGNATSLSSKELMDKAYMVEELYVRKLDRVLEL